MISFNCPFCAHSFEVADILGGKPINCPECSGDVPVPGSAPVVPSPAQQPHPQPPKNDPATGAQESATRSANIFSLISLGLGVSCLVCGCFSLPFALLFGFLALIKSGVDPVAVGGIRVKSIAGMALSVAFTVIWMGIFILLPESDSGPITPMERHKIEVNSSQVPFPIEMETTLGIEVIFHSWSIDGNQIKCELSYPGRDWRDLDVSMRIFDQNKRLLKTYTFSQTPLVNDNGFTTLAIEWNGDWDLINSLVVHVSEK